MSERLARILLSLQVLALFVGTQMPGPWREAVQESLQVGFGLSSWAHVALFTGMAWLERADPLRWPLSRVLSVALALALLTEGLQFFAIERHPLWSDVCKDMAGACAGLALSYVRWPQLR